PEKAAREIYRVLKPGGRMFVRTPNFCHYATLASCVTPNIFHALLSVDRSKEDVFKVYYRCNTGSRIQKIFSRAGFSVEKIEMIEKEPSSTRLMKNACIFLLGLFYERIVNSSVFFSGIRASIFAEFRKPLK
ncbi:MAG: hypothetical protein NTY47_07820, partial [Candidatus Omnitrophica bacterium]|nr:hypothetical protein [Candidatus Omnitrophota bacterium]